MVSNCLSVFADMAVDSSTPKYHPVPSPGGSGVKLASVFADYGFRVTIADSTQLQGVVTELTGGYTKDDLFNQRAAVIAACENMYVEPGLYGLYFYKGDYRKGDYGVASSYVGQGYDIKSSRIKMVQASVDENDNELAAMCYETLDGSTRLLSTASVPEMAEIALRA